jgi:hypothetical protein
MRGWLASIRGEDAIAPGRWEPDVRELLKAQAAEPVGNTRGQFHEFIKAETTKFARIMQPPVAEMDVAECAVAGEQEQVPQRIRSRREPQ